MSKSLEDIKKQKLVLTLKQVRGNRTAAADRLEVSVRTIRNWIKKYGIATDFPATRGRKAV